MMIYPPITELVKKTGSRYTLVIETAKRARQLTSGAPTLSNVDTNKEVTMAVNEIYEGKVESVKKSEYQKKKGLNGEESRELYGDILSSEN